MDLDLEGKTAIVTGASRGIGAGIVGSLVQEGMNVVINHYDQAEDANALCSALGAKTKVFQADVKDAAAVEAMVSFAEAEFGALDLMVHNAGITTRNPIIDTSPQDWNNVLQTNLGGAYHSARFAAKSMIRNQAKGSFIAISSLHGKIAKADMGSYCASKAAIDMMVKQLAVELAPFGIRANAIAPGTIDTGMNPVYHATDMVSSERRKLLFDRIPMAGLGAVSTIGDAVAFLASSKSEYTTGTVHFVDGGYTADGTPR